MRARFLVVAAISAACSNVESRSRETNFELLRPYDPTVRSGSLPYDNLDYALADTCCPKRAWWLSFGPPQENVAACRQLARVIERRPSMASLAWGPHCHDAIPTESLLIAIDHDERTWGWIDAVKRLSEREPSEAVQRALFRELLELEMPSDNPAISGPDDLSRFPPRTLAVALAVGGEDELRIIAKSLSSTDSHERLWAAHIFFYATSLPLDLPEVLPQLYGLTNDPDRRIAERAGIAAHQYESWSRADIDSWAALASSVHVPSANGQYPESHLALSILRYQDLEGKLLAIQLLSRRRAFCGSRMASVVLETLERDGDVRYADLAKRAIALRRERCAARPLGK